jgi:hypothetical protein
MRLLRRECCFLILQVIVDIARCTTARIPVANRLLVLILLRYKRGILGLKLRFFGKVILV